LLTAQAALLAAGFSEFIWHPQGIGSMGQALKTEWRPASLASDAADMAESVLQFSPANDAEALKLLRARFPHCPLSMRVAALDLLMRRQRRIHGRGYIPR
jgi:hypothetical protein